MSVASQAAAIVAGTFASEDLTCIATGLLIRDGAVRPAVGVVACFLGIFVGDLVLWLGGLLLGRRLLAWRPVARRIPQERVERFGEWFDRRGWAAVLASRFLPGTRFPVYVTAGIVGRRAGAFVFWAMLAALLWTPILVLSVAAFGASIVRPLQRLLGGGWLGLAAAIAAIFVLLRCGTLAFTQIGRARIAAAVSRIWRWEFWPMWLFYAPLLPWIGWLAIRHRGLMTATAANPGIPHGGVVGESKFAILSKLPAEWIVPSGAIAAGDGDARAAGLARLISEREWDYPLVLKPDAGERGAGVRRVDSPAEAETYVRRFCNATLVQRFDSGPHEAGILYFRIPGESHGRIFSVTDKHFSFVDGDGRSTVAQLIWNHRRFRMQAGRFLARLNGRSDLVLAPGERLQLAMAGNHCQGTMFCDGAALITPELVRSIDAIARAFDGLFFGRFDVRYSDRDEFRAGRGFRIVELNGATSESTNIYDPSWSLARAYAVLFRQWSLLYSIGDRNRRRGVRPSRLGDVIAGVSRHYREREVDPVSD